MHTGRKSTTERVRMCSGIWTGTATWNPIGCEKESMGWRKVYTNIYGDSVWSPIFRKGQGHKILLIMESSLKPLNLLLEHFRTEGQFIGVNIQWCNCRHYLEQLKDAHFWSPSSGFLGDPVRYPWVLYSWIIYQSGAHTCENETQQQQKKHTQLTHLTSLVGEKSTFFFETSTFKIFAVLDHWFLFLVIWPKKKRFFSFYYIFSTKTLLDWVLAKVITILELN